MVEKGVGARFGPVPGAGVARRGFYPEEAVDEDMYEEMLHRAVDVLSGRAGKVLILGPVVAETPNEVFGSGGGGPAAHEPFGMPEWGDEWRLVEPSGRLAREVGAEGAVVFREDFSGDFAGEGKVDEVFLFGRALDPSAGAVLEACVGGGAEFVRICGVGASWAGGSRFVRSRVLESVGRSRVVREVCVRDCGLDEEDVGSLCVGGFGSLRVLELSGCRLSDVGLMEVRNMLERNGGLEVLCLSRNAARDWSELPLDGVRILDVSGNFLSVGDLLGTCRNCSMLHTLRMEACGLSDEGVELLCAHLGRLEALEVLRLASNFIGDIGVEKLCEHSGKLGRLELLDLSHNSITAEGGTTLGGCLARQGFPALVALDLGDNQMRDVGCCAVANGLVEGERTKVKFLSIAFNHFLNERNTTATALAELIQTLPIQSLDIARNSLGAPGSNVLLRAATTCPTLHSLRMGMVGLAGYSGTDPSVELLCRLLPQLSSLSIEGNSSFHRSAAHALVPVLAEADHLVSLDLSGIAIGRSAGAVAEVLPSTNLRFLGLRGCGINEEGANSLLRAAEESPHLESLALLETDAGSIGVERWSKATKDAITNLAAPDGILYRHRITRKHS